MFPLLADSMLMEWGVKALGAAVLAAFVTTIANIHDPRLKMLVFSMPIPFTCAYLVTGTPIDATNMSGIVLVTLYHWVVFLMVVKWRLPLALGIGTSITGYILFAWLLKGWIKPLPLLAVTAVVVVMWALASLAYTPRQEEGHRTKSPWYVKLPLIFVIGMTIYSITGLLAGAVATFPYAGVFTSYEMRRSLRTLAGQYTINNLSFLAMFLAIALGEHLHWAKPWPLLAGWVTVIAFIWGIYALGWGKPKPAVE